MVEMKILGSREEWLQARRSTIGGSEAAAIVGASPYLDNVQLWEIKTGRRQPADLSENALVKYGTEAEKYLRELFRLDHPEYKVFYEPGNLFTNDAYPWAHASLDGWIEDEHGRRGILEIKTATIQSAAGWQKWDHRLPNNYFVQVIHYMAVYGADFAILKAQLKLGDGRRDITTRHYRIEWDEIQRDLMILISEERKFYDAVKADRRPALVLPEI